MLEFDAFMATVAETLTRATFYWQLAAILTTAFVSWTISQMIRGRIDRLFSSQGDATASEMSSRVGTAIYPLRDLTFPVMNAVFLGVAAAVSEEFFDKKWLVQFVQALNFLAITYTVATKISTGQAVRYFALLILAPVIILYGFGLIGPLIKVLDSVQFQLGNIEFTLYALARTLIFGAILFWVGRLSNQKGIELIRRQKSLTQTTKELVQKTFQIGLFVLISLMILQIAGIDLTALVVFGGAVGVGLGFGLQQIAANFISGIIILLDRSIAIGDHIELEDGRAGTLRELTMRSATLETYDGKDIMVPNERFITTAFTNWTHHHTKQRYPIVFEVAYGTDLQKLFDLLREVVASHPRVLSGPGVPIEELPDAEIQAFNDSGIEILVEFWMEGIDDGKNRVGGDLLFMIYQALREHDVEIPFPQREVVIKEDRRSR